MAFWEHAGFCGRGINGDIAQLFAELEAYRIAVWYQDAVGSGLKPLLVLYGVALCGLQDNLLNRYKRESKWLAEMARKPNRVQKEWWKMMGTEKPQVTSPKALERSIYLAHGLYLINAAFEKPWLCENRQCPRVNGRHTQVKQECGLVRYLFSCGLQLLFLAEENEEKFNYVNVRREMRRFRPGLAGWHPRIAELFHDTNDAWRGSMIPITFF